MRYGDEELIQRKPGRTTSHTSSRARKSAPSSAPPRAAVHAAEARAGQRAHPRSTAKPGRRPVWRPKADTGGATASRREARAPTRGAVRRREHAERVRWEAPTVRAGADAITRSVIAWRRNNTAPGAGIEPASYPHSKCGRPCQQSNPGRSRTSVGPRRPTSSRARGDDAWPHRPGAAVGWGASSPPRLERPCRSLTFPDSR